MSLITTAKFQATSVVKYDDRVQIYLSAVTNDSEANKSWSQFTPNGRIEMAITNPNLFDSFETGKQYFIHIASAE